MPQIELSLSVAGIAGLLLLPSAALASLYYRRTLPPVSLTKKIVLGSLRGIALFFCGLLLLEPLVRIVHTSTLPPTVAVLIDNSQSMSLTDGDQHRGNLLQEEITGVGGLSIPAGGRVRYYLFGSSLQPGSSEVPDSVTLDDPATNLSSTLDELRNQKDDHNIQAAILLSDGSSNSGENPLYAAGRLGIPIFAVGIGDSSHPRDIGITRISANEIVYEKTETPVDVTLRSSGFSGQTVNVFLEDEGRIVGQQQVRLQDGVRDYKVQLNYTPRGEGVTRVSVRVGQLEGELTGRNNRQDFFARVIKSKLRVLILSGGPSPDLSAVRYTLTEESRFSVTTRTQRLPEGFYEGALTQAALDTSDCIVLVGFPTGTTSPADLGRILRAVEEQRKPVFFIAGRSISSAGFQDLAPLLSVSQLSASVIEEMVFFHPEPSRRNHPILAASDGREGSWQNLPPVFRTTSRYRTRPEGMVLAHAQLQETVLDDPLLIASSVGGRKALSLLAYGIWRWKLMGAGDPSTADLFSSFLSSGIRWLTTREQDRGLQVHTTREFYSQGEAVEFVGQLYDVTARPVDNAEVSILVRDGDRSIELPLSPAGNGRYEGSLYGLGAGDYRYSASAAVDGDTLGSSRSRFSVGELNLEFRDTRMDAELLRRLSGTTGGAFFGKGQSGELQEALTSLQSFSSAQVVEQANLELWNWIYSLVVILLCLTVEWFLRKQSGMA